MLRERDHQELSGKHAEIQQTHDRMLREGAHTQAGQYLGRTWSLWLACGAFLLAPFWFNPRYLILVKTQVTPTFRTKFDEPHHGAQGIGNVARLIYFVQLPG